jgi:alanyl-tRNA synthetase
MQSAEIARRYLAYFEAQGHAILPSASLVADDPTLLFVVAGMQPFKPYLLGQQTPPFKRVADVQKATGRSATTSRKARSGTPGNC